MPDTAANETWTTELQEAGAQIFKIVEEDLAGIIPTYLARTKSCRLKTSHQLKLTKKSTAFMAF